MLITAFNFCAWSLKSFLPRSSALFVQLALSLLFAHVQHGDTYAIQHNQVCSLVFPPLPPAVVSPASCSFPAIRRDHSMQQGIHYPTNLIAVPAIALQETREGTCCQPDWYGFVKGSHNF